MSTPPSTPPPASFYAPLDERRYAAPLAGAAHAGQGSAGVLGFWLYLMSDCLLFASLFAAYAVLHSNTFGGPDARALFSLPYVLAETLALLTSSYTAGLGLIAAGRARMRQAAAWFGATALLGGVFVTLEVREFAALIAAGHGPAASGFLSAYFALVGTHGLHVTLGLVWMLFMLVRLLKAPGEGAHLRRLTMLAYFWHFLDLVWICIFTLVYLMPFI